MQFASRWPRSLPWPAAVAAPAAATSTASTPTTRRRWPARRRRWPRCTNRRTSCCPAARKRLRGGSPLCTATRRSSTSGPPGAGPAASSSPRCRSSPPATASASPFSASTARTPTASPANSSKKRRCPTRATPTAARKSPTRSAPAAASRTPPSTTAAANSAFSNAVPTSSIPNWPPTSSATPCAKNAKADNRFMDAAVIVALLGIALLVGELLLSTGGVLAALGALGLIAGGILALESDSGAADYVGPALIALGLLSLVAFYFITRKVIEAHERPPRTGAEELVGAAAEARGTLDPEGQVWIEGALWNARVADSASRVELGDRVRVEAVEGLTLVVSAEPPAGQAEQGAS